MAAGADHAEAAARLAGLGIEASVSLTGVAGAVEETV